MYQWGDDNEFGLQDVSAYAVEVDERTPEEEFMNNEAKESLVSYIEKYDKNDGYPRMFDPQRNPKRMEAITDGVHRKSA